MAVDEGRIRFVGEGGLTGPARRNLLAGIADADAAGCMPPGAAALLRARIEREPVEDVEPPPCSE